MIHKITGNLYIFSTPAQTEAHNVMQWNGVQIGDYYVLDGTESAGNESTGRERKILLVLQQIHSSQILLNPSFFLYSKYQLHFVMDTVLTSTDKVAELYEHYNQLDNAKEEITKVYCFVWYFVFDMWILTL